jgi:uncharacterized metal-binding protein YceD (DUF177 family)
MLALTAEAFYSAYNMAGTSDKDRTAFVTNEMRGWPDFLADAIPQRRQLSSSSMSKTTTPYSSPTPRAKLSARKPTRFDLVPSAEERRQIADMLDLIDLPAVRLKGEIRPVGHSDYALEAELVAEVVQACVVSLAPVPTKIAEKVQRRFVADWKDPEDEESEIPDDDAMEPLGDAIDLGQILTEAVALALPLYPRAPGVNFDGEIAAPPDAEPLDDEKIKPFSNLAKLLKDGQKGKE